MRDLYLPHVAQEEEAPPLHVVASCLTLDTKVIQKDVSSTVDILAEMLRIDRDVIEHILNRCFWRLEPVVNLYYDDYSFLLYDTGLTSEDGTEPFRFVDRVRTGIKITNDPKINELAWREPRKGWGPLVQKV